MSGGSRHRAGPMQQARSAPNHKTKLLPREVEAIPEGVAFDVFDISQSNLVCFFGSDHYLSSLYPSRLTIDGNEYGSVEQYYQACKLYELAGPEHALLLRNIRSPAQAKVAARNILLRLGIKNQAIDDWKANNGINMLYHAILHKFAQNRALRQKLISTGKAILAQSYERDSYFACGMNKEELNKWAKENEGKTMKIPSDVNTDLGNVRYVPLVGKGKNLLGVLCMQVRKHLGDTSNTDAIKVLNAYLSGLNVKHESSSSSESDESDEEKAPATAETDEKIDEKNDEENKPNDETK